MLIQRTDLRHSSRCGVITVKREVEGYISDRLLTADGGYVERLEEHCQALTHLVSNLIEVLVAHDVLDSKTLQEITDDYGVSYQKVQT